MERPQLKNPPLVEVILEIRWKLKKNQSGNFIDPFYSVIPGRLYDRLSQDYPYIEQLPSVNIPDEISPYIVKQRFRKGENEWPLIQVGPGIFTCNHTDKYTTFKEFCPLALKAIETLFEVYPDQGALTVKNILLRYIDAVDFDFNNENIFQFLRNKMKVEIALPDKIYNPSRVQGRPVTLHWKSSFRCENPKGLATISFATGYKNDIPALIWEQTIESNQKDLEGIHFPGSFEEWINNGHHVTDECFFTLIEGELEGEFKNEK